MGHKPEMGAIQPVRLYGEGDQSVTVTPEGKLSVDAQVTAGVADSKIKGSTDAGTTWVPVRVNSSGQLEVTLSGRNVPIEVIPISVSPLTAGGLFTAPFRDMTTLGVHQVAYAVRSDQPTEVTIESIPASGSAGIGFHAKTTLPTTSTALFRLFPPIRVLGSRYRAVLRNNTPIDQTVLEVYELRYHTDYFQPQNIPALLVYNLAVRDTNNHTRLTDASHIWETWRIAIGGGKTPIYINSTLNQAATVSVVFIDFAGTAYILGSIEVPAGQRVVVTNQDFPGLDVPAERLALEVRCAVAPTSGVITASTDLLIGGV